MVVSLSNLSASESIPFSERDKRERKTGVSYSTWTCSVYPNVYMLSISHLRHFHTHAIHTYSNDSQLLINQSLEPVIKIGTYMSAYTCSTGVMVKICERRK